MKNIHKAIKRILHRQQNKESEEDADSIINCGGIVLGMSKKGQ
jgi:hypothetical protein